MFKEMAEEELAEEVNVNTNNRTPTSLGLFPWERIQEEKEVKKRPHTATSLYNNGMILISDNGAKIPMTIVPLNEVESCPNLFVIYKNHITATLPS